MTARTDIYSRLIPPPPPEPPTSTDPPTPTHPPSLPDTNTKCFLFLRSLPFPCSVIITSQAGESEQRNYKYENGISCGTYITPPPQSKQRAHPGFTTCNVYLAWMQGKRWVECCFTSTETVGLLGTGAQDVHLDFHTAPELCGVKG